MNIRSITNWFFACILVFLVSIFLHECGHGFANALNGIACSTGFNRVGDINKYPTDVDFRSEYSLRSGNLIDFGVPMTLFIAVISTILLFHTRNKYIEYITLLFAVTNSMLRLIPCLWEVLTPLITGGIHIEDEYEVGRLLYEITGLIWLTYVPAIFSIVVSVLCLIFIAWKLKNKMPLKRMLVYELITFIGFVVTMVAANYLDNLVRINWEII
jgi:hypothetical protein